MIIPDASVIGKLFLSEEDSPAAEALVQHALANDLGLIAPAVLIYEVLSIAVRHSVPFGYVLDIFDSLKRGGLDLREPTRAELITAEKITTTGQAKSGYPALNDSIFHAMAIERGGVFVTADKRHFAKTKHFGSVVLLADWRPA
jgi:predicted nucleic acid-binding protein